MGVSTHEWELVLMWALGAGVRARMLQKPRELAKCTKVRETCIKTESVKWACSKIDARHRQKE